METTTPKELSTTPMIMGIIGFVSSIPGIACAGCTGLCGDACSTALSNVATDGRSGVSGGLTTTVIILFVVPAIVGLISGFMAKSNPKRYGWLFIGSALISLLGVFILLNFFWGLITVICFSIGGAICLTHKS